MLRLIFVMSLVSCQQFTRDELHNIFGSKKCIQGEVSLFLKMFIPQKTISKLRLFIIIHTVK